MKSEEILLKLQNIFRNVLKDNSLVLTKEMTPENVEGWNSLAHAEIIMSIEQEFEFKFSLREMMNLDSIDGILTCLEGKL